MKPLVRRALADCDVESAVDYYLGKGDADVALAFVDAIQDAYGHLSRHPGTGSPRYAQLLGIDGLRSWPMRSFPYIVFYFERPDLVEVWRVLHANRDLPVHLQESL
ncbi:type II toxin-antitoxin system RelE/ParE family toxin [Ramlibacter sp. G-1-2-2]|uniref:Type II toxin-antitoxin system RelE/ParE family toxin n=1 Tax=Ramlibacter agri TaxID=2728837 RepID=A0A848H756_9BURK|nr:type II toxin-antitoxin system RelE/ParE family toxin [Ramlibacter agri]NML45732.1 type II toxin-antitoxin system RelE/ParE family toxin [Ramlibacter agri]